MNEVMLKNFLKFEGSLKEMQDNDPEDRLGEFFQKTSDNPLNIPWLNDTRTDKDFIHWYADPIKIDDEDDILNNSKETADHPPNEYVTKPSVINQ